jgi:uncharacterized protein
VFVASGSLAQAIVPPLVGHVTDQTGTLGPEQIATLEQTLSAFEARKGTQLAVLIISSVLPEAIEQYALRVAESWKLGRKQVDDGVILVVAKDDRTLRIEVGYGLEGALPDITAKSIIDNEITPNFKDNDFYRGLDEGTNAIIAATKGEYKAPENYNARKKGTRKNPGLLIMIIIFIIIWIIKNGRGGGGSYGRGGHRHFGSPFFFPIGGGSSGFGESSGGGGFGGFGGGSFGGGGSGGSW